MSRKFEILQDEDVDFGSGGEIKTSTPPPKKIDFEEFDLGGAPQGQMTSPTTQVRSATGYVPPASFGSPQPGVGAGGYVPPAFGAPPPGASVPMRDFNQPPQQPEQMFGSQGAANVDTIIPPKEVPPARFYEPQYYQFLFNVDTRDVFIRIIKSLIPFPNDFFSRIEGNPDLYGPFWIASTLIFVLAAVGNITNWIKVAFNPNIDGADSSWNYDDEKLGISAGVIYGYLAIIPTLVWGFCRYFKIPLGWVNAVCIYGYSFFVFIPTTVICVAPFNLVHWLSVGFSTLLSTLFLLFNFFPVFRPHLGPGLIMLAVVGVLQAGFGIFQIYFFVGTEATKNI